MMSVQDTAETVTDLDTRARRMEAGLDMEDMMVTGANVALTGVLRGLE